MKAYALFNPMAANSCGEEKALLLKESINDLIFVDMTQIESYKDFFNGIDADDRIIICGGDGTLNNFINQTDGLDIQNDIYYYATGSGNDFLRDLELDGSEPICITEHLKNLPYVIVNGIKRRFLNGVGFGIDGYCCEVGDEQRRNNPKEKIDYTKIAIKGLLGAFKPANATVYVDGEEHRYKSVWIAPTMVGRFYGGGIMPAPAQSRYDREDHLSVSVFHCKSKLKALIIFPSLFKGTHVKRKKVSAIMQGKHIRVVFDSPRALQIDGETVLNVTEYEAFI